jgi:hypothetical protein
MNAANEYGLTPLHCAVRRDYVWTVIDLLSLGAAADIPDPRGKTALSLAARKAAKYPFRPGDRPWAPQADPGFKPFMKHHRTALFSAAALVAAAAAAAKPSRRGLIRTLAELQNQREVVEQLLLAALQQDPVGTHAALQQHWPESWQAAVLVTGLVLDVWSAAAAELSWRQGCQLCSRWLCVWRLNRSATISLRLIAVQHRSSSWQTALQLWS